HLPRQPPSYTLCPYTTLFRSPVVVAKPRSLLFSPKRKGRTVDKSHQGTWCRQDCQDQGDHQQGDEVPEQGAEDRTGKEDESKERSEEHTSELQSRFDLVCRLL